MENNSTPQEASIIDEGLAELVWRLNETLRDHIRQDHLRWPRALTSLEERQFAILGARNCLHRMNLNYPDDVLAEGTFAKVATDLVRAFDGMSNDGISINEGWIQKDLRDYQNMGLIAPRYRVRKKKGIDFRPGLRRQFHYSRDGKLLSLTFGGWSGTKQNPNLPDKPPQIPPFISPVIYYSERGALLEKIKPGTADYKQSTPLFCFSQLAQFLKIRRVVTTSINLLTTGFDDYRKIRIQLLPALKKQLGKVGDSRLCHNPPCINPLGDGTRSPYCRPECRATAVKTRQRYRAKAKP